MMQRYRGGQVARYGRRGGYIGAAAGLAKYGWQAYRAYLSARGPKRSRSYFNERPYSARYGPKKRRRYNKPKSKLKKLAKKVAVIARDVKSNIGIHIKRERNCGRMICSVTESEHAVFTATSIAILAQSLTNLKYFNPAAPATLITVDADLGAYHRDILFKSIYNTIVCKNNYQTDVVCTVYYCENKKDTDLDCLTAWTNGLADVGNPSSSSRLVYLTDSYEFKDLWKISKRKVKTLKPGMTLECSFGYKATEFDPALIDNHNLDFQKRFRGSQWVVRLEGTLGHDTVVTTERGSLQCGVDIETGFVHVIHYAAGVDLKTIEVEDNCSTTFTNEGVQGQRPIPDNIGFSLA